MSDELGISSIANIRQLDRFIKNNPPAMQHDGPVGKQHGLIDVMGDEQHGR